MNNEEFKRKYFQTLQDLDDECLLIESLPNPELEHFNELMNYLIEHQDIYIKECQELYFYFEKNTNDLFILKICICNFFYIYLSHQI